MRLHTPLWFLLTLPFCLAAASGCSAAQQPLPAGITLPPGFSISVYAGNVPGARSMALGAKGTLFVGTRGEGKVYAIIDHNGDHKAAEVITIASGLQMPNGVAFRNGSLYVAEVSRVLRYDNIEERLENPPRPVIVNASFPDKTHHGWKFIRFGPDGKLYVPVGAPCNVCEEQDPRFATIMRMDPDGSHLEIFASGVRNTVGFDWHPRDQGPLVYRQRPRLAGGRPAAGRTQSCPAGRTPFRFSLLARA